MEVFGSKRTLCTMQKRLVTGRNSILLLLVEYVSARVAVLEILPYIPAPICKHAHITTT